MSPLQRPRKFTAPEYGWLALVALYAISIFNLGGYFLVVLLVAYLMLHVRDIILSPLMLSLVFFSGFYFSFYFLHFDMSITEVFNYLIAPWAAFAFGEIFTRRFTRNQGAYWIIGVVALGLFAHGFLNLMSVLMGATIDIEGRVAYDFWRKEMVSVTVNGLFYSMALGLAFGAIFSEFKKWIKVLAVAVIAVALVNAILLGHRTTLFIVILILAFNVVILLLRPDTPRKVKLQWIAAGFGVLMLVMVAYAVNIGGFRTWIEGSLLFARMTDADAVNSSSRVAIWISFLKQALFYPFGGSAFRLLGGQKWVHNLWFDVYYKVGIVPFVCLIITTVLIVKQLFSLRRQCKRTGQHNISTMLTNLYLAVMLSCMVEPVIDANPYVLISFFMITGCVSGILMKGQGDAV